MLISDGIQLPYLWVHVSIKLKCKKGYEKGGIFFMAPISTGLILGDGAEFYFCVHLVRETLNPC